MRTNSRPWWALGVLLLAPACAQSRPWSQEPVPVAGLPDVLTAAATTQALSPTACLGRLADARSNMTFTLVRSLAHPGATGGALGDYEVMGGAPPGLGSGQLVRVECGSGRVLGAVRRDP